MISEGIEGSEIGLILEAKFGDDPKATLKIFL